MLPYPLQTTLIAVFLIFSLGGCASPSIVAESKRDNDLEKVSVVHWSHPEDVTLLLDEYSIRPAGSDKLYLELMVGKAYRLRIKNEGRKFHLFEAGALFRSVALSKVRFGKETEVETPMINKIRIGAGKSVTLFLVPMKKGVYDLICGLKLHLNAGMRGGIMVRDQPATL